MYDIAPPAIDRSIFFFHKCSKMVMTIPISSGIPWLPDKMDTSLRQYTTNIPKIEHGRARPRY